VIHPIAIARVVSLFPYVSGSRRNPFHLPLVFFLFFLWKKVHTIECTNSTRIKARKKNKTVFLTSRIYWDLHIPVINLNLFFEMFEMPLVKMISCNIITILIA
jgi:hypothetical protein